MRRGLAALLVVVVMAAVPAWSGPTAAAASGTIQIVHTPPSVVLPGLQINLTAVLKNATAASVTWNNGSMATDAVAPMTNTSVSEGGGWVYDAWLPAQPDGVQVSYELDASNGAANVVATFFLTVSAPSPSGLTLADQEQWMLTMAASLAMAISVVAVLYIYTGRRLRREVR